MNLIIEAAQFAKNCHVVQTRKYSGDPYIWHPMRVAGRAAMLDQTSEVIVAAAWLHDVVEDTNVTNQVISQLFGEVGVLVKQLTNVSKITHPKANRSTRKQIDLEHTKSACDDAKRIKMLDRMDNLRDMPIDEDFIKLYLKESKQLLDGALRGVDVELEAELDNLINSLLALQIHG